MVTTTSPQKCRPCWNLAATLGLPQPRLLGTVRAFCWREPLPGAPVLWNPAVASHLNQHHQTHEPSKITDPRGRGIFAAGSPQAHAQLLRKLASLSPQSPASQDTFCRRCYRQQIAFTRWFQTRSSTKPTSIEWHCGRCLTPRSLSSISPLASGDRLKWSYATLLPMARRRQTVRSDCRQRSQNCRREPMSYRPAHPPFFS